MPHWSLWQETRDNQRRLDLAHHAKLLVQRLVLELTVCYILEEDGLRTRSEQDDRPQDPAAADLEKNSWSGHPSTSVQKRRWEFSRQSGHSQQEATEDFRFLAEGIVYFHEAAVWRSVASVYPHPGPSCGWFRKTGRWTHDCCSRPGKIQAPQVKIKTHIYLINKVVCLKLLVSVCYYCLCVHTEHFQHKTFKTELYFLLSAKSHLRQFEDK